MIVTSIELQHMYINYLLYYCIYFFVSLESKTSYVKYICNIERNLKHTYFMQKQSEGNSRKLPALKNELRQENKVQNSATSLGTQDILILLNSYFLGSHRTGSLFASYKLRSWNNHGRKKQGIYNLISSRKRAQENISSMVIQ